MHYYELMLEGRNFNEIRVYAEQCIILVGADTWVCPYQSRGCALMHYDELMLEERDFNEIRVYAEQCIILVGADPCVCPTGG